MPVKRSPAQQSMWAALPEPARRANPALSPFALLAMAGARDEDRDAVRAGHARRARAVATAASARAAGDAFEAWVEHQHRLARRAGVLAMVNHFGPPVVFTGPGECHPVGVAPPDYVGLLRGGRYLVVEAKHRCGRLAIGGSDRDAIAPHQVAYLAAAEAAGALAMVVVSFERAAGVTRYAVPWSKVVEAARSPRGGALSIGPEDVCGWEVSEPHYLARFAGGGER